MFKTSFGNLLNQFLPNMTAPFYDILRTRVLNAIAEAKACASAIDHPGLTGEFREIAARQLIEPFLTQSFRCGSGKVVDTAGHMTNQIDLIVYSTRYAPAIMLYNDKGLFPVESCKYVFEIKSTLTSKTLQEAIEVGKSAQKLKRFPVEKAPGQIAYDPGGPVTVLLAFTSDLKGDELERYLKHDPSSFPCFKAILVLDKGYWVHFGKDRGWSGMTLQEVPDPPSFYASFIGGLVNTLAQEECTWRPFSPGKYMMPSGLNEKKYLKTMG